MRSAARVGVVDSREFSGLAVRGVARACCALALLALWACAEADPEPPRYAAPAQARATLVLEPPLLAVGQMADLELAVVTRPGYSVRPQDLPGKIPGFWLVEREAQAIVKEPARWVHRTRLRLRAVEVGHFEFPGGSVEVELIEITNVEVESAEGGSAVLHYAALPLEVSSSLAAHPSQRSPYGIRTLPLTVSRARGTLTAFAAGAILALASVGMLLLVRRRLAADGEARASEAVVRAPAWELAREQLAAAQAALASDPRHGLDLAAVALRGYAVRRFGGDATVRTTEELANAKPPFTMTTRWRRFIELLSELDAARFPARLADRERCDALIEGVLAFVQDSVPAEYRR